MTMPLNILECTETDSAGRMTPSYLGATLTNAQPDTGAAKLVKDFGAGYFSSGFDVRFKFVVSSATSISQVGAIHFCHTGNIYTTPSENQLFMSPLYSGATLTYYLVEFSGGVQYYAGYVLSVGTTYYLTMRRDEQVGANGTCYLHIYSDVARATLVGTVTLTLNSKEDFRYLLPLCEELVAGRTGLMTATISDIYLTKFEDLSKYTEVDPGARFTVSGDSITGTNVPRNETFYIYKDVGVGYFSGRNFTIEGESLTDTPTGSFSNVIAAIANGIGDTRDLTVASKSIFQIYTNGVGFQQAELVNGSWLVGSNLAVSALTKYYWRWTYDRTFSGAPFGRGVLSVYSNSSRTTLVGTRNLDLRAFIGSDYRYFYVCSGYNDTGAATVASWTNSNIAIIENHKFVDFNSTGWSETDPNNHISRSADGMTVTGTDLNRGESAYLYKNFGVGHFNREFYHQGELKYTYPGGLPLASLWTLANTVKDINAMRTANDDYLSILAYGIPGTHGIYLEENDAVAGRFSANATVVSGTLYYYTVYRDESAGTYGTVYLNLYTNAARTTLHASLSLTLHTSKKDFSNLYAMQSFNSSGADFGTFLHQNLDINEYIQEMRRNFFYYYRRRRAA